VATFELTAETPHRTTRANVRVQFSGSSVTLHLMLRRITALVLSTLMLQLNFKLSDYVCARHDGEPSSAVVNSAQHRDMAMPAGHQQQSAGEQTPCEIPVTRDCCNGVASCAMTFALAPDAPASVYHPSDHTGSLLRARVPASLVTAPEPPPPKA
jgi:hypothetical protein